MVNIIGGATLSAAMAAEKNLEPKKTPPVLDNNSDADRSAAVAAYMALPGFNPAAGAVDGGGGAVSGVQGSDAVQPVKQVEAGNVDPTQTAIKQFDDGLKKLVNRPETQIAQALGFNHETDPNLPQPEPIPGANENGMGALSKDDQAADTNHDGKVSEEERRRYEMPLTYRSLETEQQADAVTDGPSALSLTEANRAYGAATPPRPS